MRSVRSRKQGAFAVLAVGLIAGATPALAVEPGVHIDPGSPAAKEYAIPLSQAREGGRGGGSSGTEAALFGTGITPPSSGSGHGGGGHGSGSGHGGSGAGASGGGTGTGGATGPGASSGGSASGGGAGGGATPAAVLHGAGDSSSGGSSLLVLIGGGVAILVLAGFGGTVLRHRRGPRPTQ
ncbi:MAG TPA: hypothetical protein VFW29_12280 [Solirubrobacteraceae bacterium]|nr:hypothetical protein [Solirubrobacteraceae bacterium]